MHCCSYQEKWSYDSFLLKYNASQCAYVSLLGGVCSYQKFQFWALLQRLRWVATKFGLVSDFTGPVQILCKSAKPAFVIMWDPGKLKAYISSNMYRHPMMRINLTCTALTISNTTTSLTYYDFGWAINVKNDSQAMRVNQFRAQAANACNIIKTHSC